MTCCQLLTAQACLQQQQQQQALQLVQGLQPAAQKQHTKPQHNARVNKNG
jgi:hypothetical protein